MKQKWNTKKKGEALGFLALFFFIPNLWHLTEWIQSWASQVFSKCSSLARKKNEFLAESLFNVFFNSSFSHEIDFQSGHNML